jgi:hypothetical protein
MTSAVIADMLTLISCEEHIAPTRGHVEQRCMALDPSNPHYEVHFAPNLQLRIEHHDFEHHTENRLWLQLHQINPALCLEVAREGTSQAR